MLYILLLNEITAFDRYGCFQVGCLKTFLMYSLKACRGPLKRFSDRSRSLFDHAENMSQALTLQKPQ